ncbi:MAG: F0F1 ATP synthase subunit gamma [Candidatus Levybacteria bacterium]|nr:F0F1 ATP synthase subunit gamma [Candidatus Levybacteria bacterium]
MINNQAIQAELTRLTNLKTLIETYEEIAANRMRKNRSIVLASRLFNEGLGDMYQQIKASYGTQLITIMQRKKIPNQKVLTMIKRNGKTVSLLISSNAGLYGDIVPKITEQFIDFISKTPCDIAIIGRLGKRLFEERNLNKQYIYFDFPDVDTDPLEIEKLANFLINYEKIYIFFGKFISVGVQQPTMLDVIGEEKEEVAQKKALPQTKYLFEPSLEQVMMFFEQQIFTSLIEQTVKEAELAKFASRMVTLDSATENVKQALWMLQKEQRINQHRMQNKKQQELLTGISLWGKT